MCNASVEFQLKYENLATSVLGLQSKQNLVIAEEGKEIGTEICNARAQPLSCSLNRGESSVW